MKNDARARAKDAVGICQVIATLDAGANARVLPAGKAVVRTALAAEVDLASRRPIKFGAGVAFSKHAAVEVGLDQRLVGVVEW